MSQLLCTLHELFFVRCIQVIICVLHDSKKHASNALCALRESVFLCTACKLHLLPEKDQGIQQKSTPAKHDKTCEHEENNICQVFMYPYSNPF